MRRDGQSLRSLILQACRGGTGLATQLMAGKADAPQVPGLFVNAGLTGECTWFPKVKISDEAAQAGSVALL